MAHGADTYTIQEFEAYLELMEQSARDWVRERLTDDEFMALYHTRLYRCVSVELMGDDEERPPEVTERIDELLEHFRNLRRFLGGIDHTIREYRKYGLAEEDLMQKVAVLGRYLTELNFDYRPLTAGSHDPPPPPAPSPG